VSIEARSRNSNSTGPVEVVVALFVGEIPKLILRESSVIAYDLVLSSSNSSTSNILSNEEVFVHIWDNTTSNDASRFWVGFLLSEETIINSLVDSDFNESRVVVFAETCDSFLDFRDFNFHNELDLRFSNTISKEHNKLWETIILFFVSLQSFLHKCSHTIDDFLTHKILNMRYGDILSEVLVVRSTESNDTLLGFSSIVIDISTYKHSVFWKTFRTLDDPKIVSAFNMHLLKDIWDNRFVELLHTSSSDSAFKNNLGENSNIFQRNLFNFFVILLFFVVKEDKDKLEYVCFF